MLEQIYIIVAFVGIAITLGKLFNVIFEDGSACHTYVLPIFVWLIMAGFYTITFMITMFLFATPFLIWGLIAH